MLLVVHGLHQKRDICPASENLTRWSALWRQHLHVLVRPNTGQGLADTWHGSRDVGNLAGSQFDRVDDRQQFGHIVRVRIDSDV